MKIDSNENFMEEDMEIELLISSKDTNNQKEVSRLSYADADITVGPLLLDTVKLESHKLQGRRAKLVQSWDADTGMLQLVLSCTAHSRPIEVDGIDICGVEHRIIDETSKIRMGEYRIRARLNAALGTGKIPKSEEEQEDGFELISFSPAELDINKPPRSKLYEKSHSGYEPNSNEDPEPLSKLKESIALSSEDQAELSPKSPTVHPTLMEKKESEIELTADLIDYKIDEKTAESAQPVQERIQQQDAIEEALKLLTPEPEELTVVENKNSECTNTPIESSNTPIHYDYEIASSYDELSTRAIENKANRIESAISNASQSKYGEGQTDYQSAKELALDSDSVEEHIIEFVVEADQNNEASLLSEPFDSSDGQVLFNKVVGENNINNLDFQALKLLSISGRLTHHHGPLANVTVSAGNIGKCQTNEDGYFVFHDIVEGTKYNLTADLKGYKLSGSERLNGILYENLDMNLTTTRLCRVSGKIKHLGKPLGGVKLDAGPFGVCESDENGIYVFHDVPEDCTLRIRATCPGFQFHLIEKVSPVESKSSNNSEPIPLRREPAPNHTAITDETDDLADSLALLMNR